jgi:hypothetical protein
VFLGHPSLQFGYAPDVIRTLGNDSRNAVLLIGEFSFRLSRMIES